MSFRRLPVYILADCSGSMSGDPIESVKAGISALHSELMNDPSAVESAYLSVITFDSNARRHTSFASIWVYPVIDDSIEIDVSEADVRIDTYRASGAGGQHVNTTDSAVRITHIASGIVVACQKERSQHKNRATAWDMLRSRLYEEELKKREEAANATEASKTDIGWGHQIRSYVLQPYQLVKDLRTGVESTSPQSVLDGDLDDFMQAALSARIEGGDSQPVADLE